MQTRVLIVEDDEALARVISDNLRFEGYEVEATGDGNDAITRLRAFQPDIVLLDIMLPNRNGLDLCAVIRQGGRVPVIILSARSQKADKIKGLQLGADDYLAKPFDYDELLARVKALLRRASIRAGETMMRVGDLSIDPISREVTRAGRKLALTQKEYALLEYLMRHAGIPVTREQISEQVWKQPFDPTTNIVDVYINYLRKKLETDGGTPLVHTVRGVGYVLRETPTPDS